MKLLRDIKLSRDILIITFNNFVPDPIKERIIRFRFLSSNSEYLCEAFTDRWRRSAMFYKISFIKNLTKFLEKHLRVRVHQNS